MERNDLRTQCTVARALAARGDAARQEAQAQRVSERAADRQRLAVLEAEVAACRGAKRAAEAVVAGQARTINRPCAQQYVGKSRACMVISDRLIVHAPVQRGSRQGSGSKPL